MNVSNKRDKDTRKVLLKILTGLPEFEILFVFTCLSKFTSKVLYTVSSLPRNNKKNVSISPYLLFSANISYKQTIGGGMAGGKHSHAQIKCFNTEQSFKVFGFKVLCSCQI